jgi:hypothetical protein
VKVFWAHTWCRFDIVSFFLLCFIENFLFAGGKFFVLLYLELGPLALVSFLLAACVQKTYSQLSLPEV